MLWLLLALVVVPVVELYVMVQVAGVIGALPTVLAVVALSFGGAWLMKVEGLGVLRRLQRQVAQGETPADEVVNGVLVLLGGLLMFVPGFVTAAVGLALLLPPVRAVLRPLVLSRARRRFAGAGSARFAVFTTGFGPPGAAGPAPGAFGGRVYEAESQPWSSPSDPGSGPGLAGPPELEA